DEERLIGDVADAWRGRRDRANQIVVAWRKSSRDSPVVRAAAPMIHREAGSDRLPGAAAIGRVLQINQRIGDAERVGRGQLDAREDCLPTIELVDQFERNAVSAAGRDTEAGRHGLKLRSGSSVDIVVRLRDSAVKLDVELALADARVARLDKV